MKKLTLLAVLTLLLSACIPGLTEPAEEATDEADETMVEEPGLGMEQDTNLTMLEAQVSSFMNAFMAAAPPADEMAVEQATTMLSSQAAELVREAPSMSAGLAQFAGVQDVPDEGYQIGSITMMDEYTAEVETTWNYSGGPVNKTLVFVMEEMGWMLDAIR